MPHRLACALVLCICAPATASESLTALPASMTGTWGYEPRSCTEVSDDGRVRVGPREVEFFASSCRLSSVRREPSGALAATGRCRGEGDSTVERGVLRFRQIDSIRLEITMQGSTHVYGRCARPIPVR